MLWKHGATAGRVFAKRNSRNALRIAVNGELEAVSAALPRVSSLLASGRRLGYVSIQDFTGPSKLREHPRGSVKLARSSPLRNGLVTWRRIPES